MRNRACVCSLIFLLSTIACATTINSVTLSGTQLTIRGNGFSGTPLTLSFNGKSLPIISRSSTQIIATLSPVPAPGSYRLAVKSGTASAITTFTISSPSMVATVALFDQTGAIPTTVLWTPPTNGLYRATIYEAETVAGSANGQWAAVLQWSDSVGPQSLEVDQSSAAVNEHFVEQPMRLLEGGAITYEVINEDVSSGTYELVITLEQLTNQ